MPESADDYIIQEVREARRKLLKDAASEDKSLLEYLIDSQKRHGSRLVSRQPRKLVRSKTG